MSRDVIDVSVGKMVELNVSQMQKNKTIFFNIWLSQTDWNNETAIQ